MTIEFTWGSLKSWIFPFGSPPYLYLGSPPWSACSRSIWWQSAPANCSAIEFKVKNYQLNPPPHTLSTEYTVQVFWPTLTKLQDKLCEVKIDHLTGPPFNDENTNTNTNGGKIRIAKIAILETVHVWKGYLVCHWANRMHANKAILRFVLVN